MKKETYIMDQRFLWLTKTLTKGDPIPVLDCYTLKNNKIASLFSMNQKLKAESSDPIEILSKIYREFSLMNRLSDNCYPPCYFFVDQRREAVEIQELERYVKSGVFDREISLIQVPKATFKQEEYTLKLTKGKLSTFYSSHDRQKKNIKDPELYSKVKLVAKQAIKTIHKHIDKQVIHIEIDFQTDINRHLWITDLKDIKFRARIQKSRTLLRTAKDMVSNKPKDANTERNGRNSERTSPTGTRHGRHSQLRHSRSRATPRNFYHCTA